MTILLLSLFGCIDEQACTTIAVYSTTIALVDEAGAPIAGATLQYTVDGEEPPLPCEELDTASYACGVETEGHFVITASAEGYEDASAEVDVAGDECHPIPEALTLTMTEVACTAEAEPAVIVTLSGSGGETLSNPQVAYTQGDTAASIACESSDGVTWACAEELSGDFVITAAADGHDTEHVEVVVEAGECGPITEEIEIALDWLPD